MALYFLVLSENQPETPWTRFWVVSATPSTMPTMLPLALSVCVRNIGRMGYNISEEMSANRLVRARRNELVVKPENSCIVLFVFIRIYFLTKSKIQFGKDLENAHTSKNADCHSVVFCISAGLSNLLTLR